MSNSFRMIEYEGEDAGQVLFHILTGGKAAQAAQEDPQPTSKIGFSPNKSEEEEHEQE